MKALKAQKEGKFDDQIVPINISHTYVDENNKRATNKYTVTKDEGPREGTNTEVLNKLRPVFSNKGSVTAGNSSQMSDGAAFTLIMSEAMVNELNLKPIARMVNYAVAEVEPRIMGIGPVKAVPKVLKQSGLNLNDISLIELNEAFASQSLAVINELDLDKEIINVLFRAVHTIKGNAGIFNLNVIVDFSHKLENLLDKVRNDEIELTDEMIDFLLKAGDHLKVLVELLGELDLEQKESHEELLKKLDEYLNIKTNLDTNTNSSTKYIRIDLDENFCESKIDLISTIKMLDVLGEIKELNVDFERLPKLNDFDENKCYLSFDIVYESEEFDENVLKPFKAKISNKPIKNEKTDNNNSFNYLAIC